MHTTTPVHVHTWTSPRTHRKVHGHARAQVDLRDDQVQENRRQAARICAIATAAEGARWQPPKWVCADARELPNLAAVASAAPFDCLFSCPPYYDLERYSDDERDLSEAPTYDEFLQAYRHIIGSALARLAPNRFAIFVVGEIRDADGFCRNFVADTISAFQEYGARLYNNAIMMLPLASLPMRANSAFAATAKLGTCHQHVLVFWKGKAPNRDVKTIGLHNASKPLEWF